MYKRQPLLCSSVSRPKNVLEILFSLFVLFLGESLKQAGLAGVIQQLDDVEWSTVTRGTRYWASLACTVSIDRCYCSSSVCPRLGPATLRAPGCGRKSSLTFPDFCQSNTPEYQHQTSNHWCCTAVYRIDRRFVRESTTPEEKPACAAVVALRSPIRIKPLPRSARYGHRC